MGKLERKMIMAHLAVHQKVLQVQGHCVSYQFWHWQCFWRNPKDIYHLPVMGPRTIRKAQPGATGHIWSKVKLPRRDKTALIHRLQADTASQFRTVSISLFLAPSLLFSLYPSSPNSIPSSKLLPEILKFIKCKSDMSLSFKMPLNPPWNFDNVQTA